MINEIVEVLGSYTPIIIDGKSYTNWGQIAAYVIICICLYGLITLLGRLVIKR